MVDTKQPACYAVNVVKKNTERGNMKKLIIAAHGYLARGIKSTLEIISGSVDDVIDINAFTEECPSPEPVIREEIKTKVYQGELKLLDLGCGDCYHLIVTGPCRGEVWNLSDVGAQPCCERQDFLGWFELWLDNQDRTDYFKDYLYQ